MISKIHPGLPPILNQSPNLSPKWILKTSKLKNIVMEYTLDNLKIMNIKMEKELYFITMEESMKEVLIIISRKEKVIKYFQMEVVIRDNLKVG